MKNGLLLGTTWFNTNMCSTSKDKQDTEVVCSCDVGSVSSTSCGNDKSWPVTCSIQTRPGVNWNPGDASVLFVPFEWPQNNQSLRWPYRAIYQIDLLT